MNHVILYAKPRSMGDRGFAQSTSRLAAHTQYANRLAGAIARFTVRPIARDGAGSDGALLWGGALVNARLDLQSVRARHPIPGIAGSIVKLQRAGNEWKACCPFHPDRSPSFTIYDGGQRFCCFGCGAAGDVLDFVQRTHRVGLREAVALLEGGNLPATTFTPPAKPAERVARDDEALALWRAAQAPEGTLAQSYLASRGIMCRLPQSVRFARLPYGVRGACHPVLLALVTDAHDRPIGIQRTFLNAAGTGKAAVPKPKLSLGRIAGGAIRLAPPSATLVIAEGLEDALSVQQSLGMATWATAGTGGMVALQLPPGVRNVVIAADNDDAGERAARTAADRFAGEGRKCRIIRPMEGFKDFNAELMGAEA